MKKELRRDWQLWVMALLGLIWVIVFCYTPMYGIQLAFKDYDFTKGLTGGDWAGIKYFMMYFNSPAFATTMRNTFVIAFFSIVVGFPLPIILALAINQLKRGRLGGFCRLRYIFPTLFLQWLWSRCSTSCARLTVSLPIFSDL